ncbi:MAG: ribose 5-phosphate isomerase A [Parachlamydiales bacterium]|jgi:ribose 5-phosphate isomerase A
MFILLASGEFKKTESFFEVFVIEKLKQKAAGIAAEAVQDGQLIGVGSGSTVNYFIDRLIQRRQKERLRLKVAAASLESARRLEKGGFELEDLNRLPALDVVFDGADLVDQKGNLVKGRGGALFREKMLFLQAKKIVVMVEGSKLKKGFLDFLLPVEVVPFGAEKTQSRLGFAGSFRKNSSQGLFQTDNGNLILDLKIPSRVNPKALEKRLKQTCGVVETGLFLGFHPQVIAVFASAKDG